MESVTLTKNYPLPDVRAFKRLENMHLRCMCRGILHLEDNIIVDAEEEWRGGVKHCVGVDYGYIVQCGRCGNCDIVEDISGLIASIREFQGKTNKSHC